MNLSEALDAALPEIPITRLARARPPCLDPDLVVREDLVDGEPMVGIMQRGKNSFFRFTPKQWQLLQLFDGVRTYDEIAELHTAQTAMPISAEEVRTYAEVMERDDFWYKTPQERNLALSQKLLGQRGRRAGRKSKLNLAHMTFSGWDPDNYLNWLDRAVGRYVYSPLCTIAAVLLFLFEASVFISKWNVIGPDIPLYYNFTQNPARSGAVLAIVPGARVLSRDGSWPDLQALRRASAQHGPDVHLSVAGILCGRDRDVDLSHQDSATGHHHCRHLDRDGRLRLWNDRMDEHTAGEWLHDFAYQIILITGIAVVVMNLNPLIKLDGYYFLTEFIGIPDLKERSTAFISGWFQSRVLRLPVEMIVVPRKRAPFFIIYAVISGIYSYTLLFFVIRLSYNITSKWMAELALIPAGALALLMFRSRLRALRGVAVRFWQQHFTSIRNLRPVHFAVAAVLVVILFVPLWRDRESAYFVIEPARSETVHAAVSGRVQEVLVHEGEMVHAGQPLLRMSSPMAASMHSRAVALTGDSRYQAVTAELHGESIGTAAALQSASARSTGMAGEAQTALVIAAPADGTMMTQDPGALLDQDVGSGQPLLDLADAGPRVVRVYIPVSTLDRIPPDADVALALPDRFSVVQMTLAAPGSDAVSLPPGLVQSQEYKGIKMPVFYCSRMTLPLSAGNPPFGIAGAAKIFGKRRSLMERCATSLYNLAKAHLW